MGPPRGFLINAIHLCTGNATDDTAVNVALLRHYNNIKFSLVEGWNKNIYRKTHNRTASSELFISPFS